MQNDIFSETTSSVGIGPVSLDLEMAREHGWSPERIATFWREVGLIYENNSRSLQVERPDLHAIAGDGSIVHTSSKFRHPSDTRYERKMIRLHNSLPLPGGYTVTAPPDDGPEVDAYVVGEWAAHRTIGVLGGEWSVTYVPHGTNFPCGELDEYEARRAICHIHRLTCSFGFDPLDQGHLYYVQAVIAQVVAFEDLAPDGIHDADYVPELRDKQGDIY